MSWATIASAVGGAAKTTLLTAPETPDSTRSLFLAEEADKRAREDEIAGEQRKAEAAQKKINDRKLQNDAEIQEELNQTIVNPSEIIFVTPTGVAEVENWAAGMRPGMQNRTQQFGFGGQPSQQPPPRPMGY